MGGAAHPAKKLSNHIISQYIIYHTRYPTLIALSCAKTSWSYPPWCRQPEGRTHRRPFLMQKRHGPTPNGADKCKVGPTTAHSWRKNFVVLRKYMENPCVSFAGFGIVTNVTAVSCVINIQIYKYTNIQIYLYILFVVYLYIYIYIYIIILYIYLFISYIFINLYMH